jgi:hypothetical protein
MNAPNFASWPWGFQLQARFSAFFNDTHFHLWHSMYSYIAQILYISSMWNFSNLHVSILCWKLVVVWNCLIPLRI